MVKTYYKERLQSRLFLRGGIVEMAQDIFLFRLKSAINIESLLRMIRAGLCVVCTEVQAGYTVWSVARKQASTGHRERHVSDPSSDIQGMREGSRGR